MNENITEAKKEEKTSIKTSRFKAPKLTFWVLSTIFLLIALIVVSIVFWQSDGTIGGKFIQTLSKDQVANKTVNFLNENLVQPGTAVSLVSVEETSGIYKVTVYYQNQTIPVYATEDGNFLILQQGIINMTQTIPKQEEPEQTEQPTEMVKTDKPEAHAFIMSYCPYGIQFLKAYVPVMELLGSKADLQVNFISYAMHGEKELTENTRMYCIQKEQKDKLTKYLGCFADSTDAEKCIAEAKIDKTKLETCMNAVDKQFNITNLYNDKNTWSGGRYPQYPVEATLAAKYGAQGSPTFVLNGVQTSVQRTSEAIKQAICSAFTTPPAECGSALNSTASATSGSCG